MDFSTLIDEVKATRNGHSVQARTDGSTLFDTPASFAPIIFNFAQAADSIPAWSIYPTIRDTFLRSFYKTEEKLSGAVYSMVSFAKALDLQVDGLPRAKKYAQTILNDCENGRGYRQLIAKSMLDWNTQDNGFFWELIGSGRADKPLRGALLPPYIMHLDSLLCWRTFDEEFPVVYRNPITGQYHKLHYTRVIYRSCMEQPDELARGIGLSPVGRVLRLAQMMRDILIYRHEKVSGKFNRAILYGTGITAQQLNDSKQAADEAAESMGFAVYKGIPAFVHPMINMDLKLLDLASLGDGFDLEKETTLYMYILSLAFGVDAREFWPASQSGATKADASIQDMKTQQKGKGDNIETLHGCWRDVFPETVEAVYDYTDDEQDFQRARINQIHVVNFDSMKGTGVIDADEARLHLVKEGVLDPALLKATTPQTATAEPVSDATPQQDEENAQGKPDSPTTGDKPTEEADTEAAKGLKELSATREDFFLAIGNVFDGAVARDYNRAQFQTQLYRLIRRYGELAYRDGLSDGGVELDTNEPLEREDMRTMNALLSDQQGYVEDIGAVLYNEDVSDDITVNKPPMWWNKSIIPFYQAGLASADANGLYEWILGQTEIHCDTCKTMSGQKHRMFEYVDRGVLPQGSSLDCHGYNCDCRLEKTRGRARGRWV